MTNTRGVSELVVLLSLGVVTIASFVLSNETTRNRLANSFAAIQGPPGLPSTPSPTPRPARFAFSGTCPNITCVSSANGSYTTIDSCAAAAQLERQRCTPPPIGGNQPLPTEPSSTYTPPPASNNCEQTGYRCNGNYSQYCPTAGAPPLAQTECPYGCSVTNGKCRVSAQTVPNTAGLRWNLTENRNCVVDPNGKYSSYELCFSQLYSYKTASPTPKPKKENGQRCALNVDCLSNYCESTEPAKTCQDPFITGVSPSQCTQSAGCFIAGFCVKNGVVSSGSRCCGGSIQPESAVCNCVPDGQIAGATAECCSGSSYSTNTARRCGKPQSASDVTTEEDCRTYFNGCFRRNTCISHNSTAFSGYRCCDGTLLTGSTTQCSPINIPVVDPTESYCGLIQIASCSLRGKVCKPNPSGGSCVTNTQPHCSLSRTLMCSALGKSCFPTIEGGRCAGPETTTNSCDTVASSTCRQSCTQSEVNISAKTCVPSGRCCSSDPLAIASSITNPDELNPYLGTIPFNDIEIVYLDCTNRDDLNKPAYPGSLRTVEAVCHHLIVERQGSICTPERVVSTSDQLGQIIFCRSNSFLNLDPIQQADLLAHEEIHSQQDQNAFGWINTTYGISIDDTTHGTLDCSQTSMIGVAEIGAELASGDLAGDYTYCLRNADGTVNNRGATYQQAMDHIVQNCTGVSEVTVSQALQGNTIAYLYLVNNCTAPPHELVPDRIRY